MNNMNTMRLAYHYAQINLETGECVACFTCSYEIPLPNYIRIPSYKGEYVGLFYNQQDGLWYTDGSFTVLTDGFN